LSLTNFYLKLIFIEDFIRRKLRCTWIGLHKFLNLKVLVNRRLLHVHVAALSGRCLEVLTVSAAQSWRRRLLVLLTTTSTTSIVLENILLGKLWRLYRLWSLCLVVMEGISEVLMHYALVRFVHVFILRWFGWMKIACVVNIAVLWILSKTGQPHIVSLHCIWKSETGSHSLVQIVIEEGLRRTYTLKLRWW
jgi:hypothetical protein